MKERSSFFEKKEPKKLLLLWSWALEGAMLKPHEARMAASRAAMTGIGNTDLEQKFLVPLFLKSGVF